MKPKPKKKRPTGFAGAKCCVALTAEWRDKAIELRRGRQRKLTEIEDMWLATAAETLRKCAAALEKTLARVGQTTTDTNQPK